MCLIQTPVTNDLPFFNNTVHVELYFTYYTPTQYVGYVHMYKILPTKIIKLCPTIIRQHTYVAVKIYAIISDKRL